MDKSKILILVEGARIDLRLMEHLLRVYGLTERHQVVSYNTSIYELYRTMFRGSDPGELDLLQHLKEHERDPQRKLLFDERYSDILLVFDLDPQDPDYTPEKITEMAAYFTESSDMGKLYLNYPMVEAFYHMKSIPDPDYDAYTVSLDELRDGTYKQRVNEESRGHSYSKFAVNRRECSTVIQQNLEKAQRIAGGKEEFVLNAQLRALEEKSLLYVLCTCAFYILDYNPRLIES